MEIVSRDISIFKEERQTINVPRISIFEYPVNRPKWGRPVSVLQTENKLLRNMTRVYNL